MVLLSPAQLRHRFAIAVKRAVQVARGLLELRLKNGKVQPIQRGRALGILLKCSAGYIGLSLVGIYDGQLGVFVGVVRLQFESFAVRGNGIVIGPHADERTLAALRDKVTAQPRSWMAQRPVALSTSPVLIGEVLAPRHIDLRPFAVNDGEDVWLLPGGLTRVALPEGELVVNSSQGGGSKDTWVMADLRQALPPVPDASVIMPLAARQPQSAAARQSGPEQ